MKTLECPRYVVKTLECPRFVPKECGDDDLLAANDPTQKAAAYLRVHVLLHYYNLI